MPRFRVPSLPKILVHGDLREVLKDKRDIADLVYFDPPFGTGRDFGAYGDASRDLSVDDHFVPRGEIDPILKFAPDEISRVWLVYLASCLFPIRNATKQRGSFWIHIDERYSHLARLLCDRLLAPAKWRSTIVWAYRRWPSKSRRFQSFHDVLFHYAPEDGTFNVLYDELSASSIAKWGRNKKVKAMVDGRITSVSTDEPSPGVPMGDVWSISIIAPKSKERDRGCRFPTQKPVDLIKRVILSTSSVGDVLLDPGVGSGTSLVAANEHGRGWIGIDRSKTAIDACEKRLRVRRIIDA